jgi:hypothetical protein
MVWEYLEVSKPGIGLPLNSSNVRVGALLSYLA